MNEVSPPSNVKVVDAAPHRRILPRASAMITHCGHATLLKSLAEGVPVLGMPIARDQHDNAARLENLGAGLVLQPNSTSEKIGAALTRLLKEPSYGEAARAFRTQLQGETGNSETTTEVI